MPKQLTIRGLPDEIGQRLQMISRETKQSCNATVVAILSSAVGYAERRKRLQRYATWTDADRVEFESALSAQRAVNDDDWI